MIGAMDNGMVVVGAGDGDVTETEAVEMGGALVSASKVELESMEGSALVEAGVVEIIGAGAEAAAVESW